MDSHLPRIKCVFLFLVFFFFLALREQASRLKLSHSEIIDRDYLASS